MIGSLMYLTSSRPDIMFVVCACARFQVTPKDSHLVKRIFRYLKGQTKLGLWYPKDSPFDLGAYTDSDYTGASLDRKSKTGVANSTTKAEYVAASSCCRQIDDWNGLEMLRMKLGLKLCCQEKVNAARLLTTARLPLELQLLRTMVAYLEKYTEHANFDEIVDFLNASPIRYALIVSPTIYVFYIEQFWSIVKIKIINKERQIRAKVNGKTIVISESSVRRDLQFNDDDDETVHEERGDSMERVAITAASLDAKQDNGNIIRTQSMATLNKPFPQGTGSGSGPKRQDIILGDKPAQTRFERMSKQSNEPPLSGISTPRSGEDRLKIMELMEIYTKLSDRVLALENVKTAQDLEITSLKKREDASKQGRIVTESDQDEEISFVQEDAETQGRYDQDIDVTTVSAPITTAGVSVSTTEPSTPPTTTTVIEYEDLTIAQTIMKIRSEESKEKAKERGSQEKI
ncbi:hypothetical protein Tco_0264753 [Tanacetum coccineum]